MKKRKLSEDEAYHLLRKIAMESNRTIADVSEDLITMSELIAEL